MDRAKELIVVDLVFAELVYVLESYYERSKSEVARLSRSLLAMDSVVTADHDLLLRSLDLYELEKLDYAEAYLVALAETSGIEKIASFDRQLTESKRSNASNPSHSPCDSTRMDQIVGRQLCGLRSGEL